MSQNIECADCEGTGKVGYIGGHSRLIPGLCGHPFAVTPQKARSMLRSHPSGWLGRLADKVEAFDCRRCKGSGVAFVLTQMPVIS